MSHSHHAAAQAGHGHIIHWARIYDFFTGLWGGGFLQRLHRRLLEVAAIAPGERVLDVGCGPGRLTQAAASRAGPTGKALGIDPSEEMVALALKKARKAGSPARFQLASIDALPAKDDSFDVVLASLMLHHLTAEQQERGMAEVRRVLRPGGRFIAADFTTLSGHGLGHLLTALGLRRGTDHADHLRQLAEKHGFRAVRIEPGSSKTFCVLVAKAPDQAA